MANRDHVSTPKSFTLRGLGPKGLAGHKVGEATAVSDPYTAKNGIAIVVVWVLSSTQRNGPIRAFFKA